MKRSEITAALKAMNAVDLTNVIDEATQLRAEKLESEIEKTKTQFEQHLQSLGMTPDQIYGRGSARVAKYKDPETGRTWSGKGRVPSWFEKAKTAGKERDLLIDKSAADAPAPAAKGDAKKGARAAA